MILTLTTPPTEEPLTLEEVKAHLRVTDDADDSRIGDMLESAREYIEATTGRAMLAQTWKLYLREFPQEIEIPRAPLSSITSIQYTDTAGATQTLSSSVYTVDTDRIPGRVYLAPNQTWPIIYDKEKAIVVTFVSGYASTTEIPVALLDAIKFHVELLYDRPTSEYAANIERAIQRLTAPHRIFRV